MNTSPLVQQTRPTTFKPKVVQLYESLFLLEEGDDEKPDGFWEEFFLLKADPEGLRQTLDRLTPGAILQKQHVTQDLFGRLVRRIGVAQNPSATIALETLTAFLGSIFSKRYSNLNTDVIVLLVGLEDADMVFSDFVQIIDSTIRSETDMHLRTQAVKALLCLVSGAFQSGLISYLTHQDMFPSLMKFVQDAVDDTSAALALVVLGLLSNYNKFELQNLYQQRLTYFVNEEVIIKLVSKIGDASAAARDRYVDLQDDTTETWKLSSTFNYLTLGVISGRPKTTPASAGREDLKALFATLPSLDCTILLATYEFINTNKLFAVHFVANQQMNPRTHLPFGSFMSLTSYFVQHAHRTVRSTLYCYLALIILQLLLEDSQLAPQLLVEDRRLIVRLCRQRQPFLPLQKGPRFSAEIILDILIDGINHNLRRSLDVHLYRLFTGNILRCISHLTNSKKKLSYHWAEMWKSLLSLMRFLTTYAESLIDLPSMSGLLRTLVKLLSLSLATGEIFLPDTAAYDDLFYKIVESGEMLIKFRAAYHLERSESGDAISSLISVSDHYRTILQGDKARKIHLTTKEVSSVIKQGYETLSIATKEGLDDWKPYREADNKLLMKQIVRMIVADTQCLTENK